MNAAPARPGLLRLPSVQALAIQAAALLIVALALLLLPLLPMGQGGYIPSISTLVLLQGALAALLSRWRRQAAWWPLMHLLFLPAAVAALSLKLPPWLFLAVFLAMLMLYWSTFRTQVPFYASGLAAWDAVAAVLPPHPLRMIDIGSGLGGLVLDLAARRPDSRFEGIELAPLPWLLSRLRQAAGARCRFLRGDYHRLDFAAYDVVFAYLSPAAMPALWAKASAEMRPGTLLLSHEFAVPGAAPQIIRQTRPGGPMLYGWVI
ncbi:MAG: class I SAM-dependent methyltransferase [Noviherbaspirillum sp.]